MTYKEAKQLLKSKGFKLEDFTAKLCTSVGSYRRANKDGMRPMYLLALKGFLASHSEAYAAMIKHEDNEAMMAQVKAVVEIGNELDKEGKK